MRCTFTRKATRILSLGILAIGGGQVHALELDWSGQFRSEFSYVHNYNMDSNETGDATRAAGGGYYIPGGGTDDAALTTLFLRLRPKLIVNDNIAFKSEWNLGDPVFGFFGNSFPYTPDQRAYDSTFSRGAVITAQRFWGEFQTDLGVVQVGRAPLHWGLGAVWNSGENVWDHYGSTGDVLRLVAKFGSWNVSPAFVTYSMGNTLGGSCTVTGGVCTTSVKYGGLTDYSIAAQYENADDDFQIGLNFILRVGESADYSVPQGVGNIKTTNWDLYARKKLGRFTFGAEVPVISGPLGATTYQTLAVIGEASLKETDNLETTLRAGYVPGQDSSATGTIGTYKAFYVHPSYQVGQILFHYNLANFASVQTQNNATVSSSSLRSPYDASITNAIYISAQQTWNLEKWTLTGGLLYAQALQTATTGQFFWNSWTRGLSTATAVKNQGSSLGFEGDLGATYQWDDMFQFKVGLGLFLPGSYYAFSNTATDNPVVPIFAGTVGIGINF